MLYQFIFLWEASWFSYDSNVRYYHNNKCSIEIVKQDLLYKVINTLPIWATELPKAFMLVYKVKQTCPVWIFSIK